MAKRSDIFNETTQRAPDTNIAWGVADLLLLFAAVLLERLFMQGRLNLPAMSTRELIQMLLFMGFGMFFFWGFEMYSIVLLKPWPTFVTCVLSGIYTFICTALIPFIFSRSTHGFAALARCCALGFTMLFIWRVGLYYFHKNKTHRQRMLMIERLKDDNSRVRRMKYACLSRFDAWYEQVDIDNVESVKKFIAERFPDYDVICLMETVPYEVRDLFLNAGMKMGKDFYVVPVMYEMNFAKVKFAFLDDVMVFHLLPTRIDESNMAVKRIMDVVFSLVGIIVAAVPMAIIALLIKLTSPGPVIYKQVRLTQGKRPFYIYKFRSMVNDAEAKSGPTVAVRNDPRITPVGRIIRKMRLDELPQLFNILKGDMSVVGPRPERPFFVEQYEYEIPNYDQRFAVRAGLTALSHVYGRYSTDITDRTRYDLLYVQNYSLMMDIRVMLLTSRTIFLGDAAEGVWTVDRRTVSKP